MACSRKGDQGNQGNRGNDYARRKKPAGQTVTRRGFLAAGCVGALMVAAGGFGAASGQAEVPFLRPPGAESQVDLLARCIRCQRCLQVCPYDIVTPLPYAQSLVGWGTPTLDFTHGYCDFCMRCVDECPTGALRYGTATEENIGVAIVVKDACVAWDWAGCTVCADECPVDGAIALDALNRPMVQAGVCNGCGRCEEVCPSASLRAYDNTAEAKGIVVVSRQSAAAHMNGQMQGAVLRESRYLKAGDAK